MCLAVSFSSLSRSKRIVDHKNRQMELLLQHLMQRVVCGHTSIITSIPQTYDSHIETSGYCILDHLIKWLIIHTVVEPCSGFSRYSHLISESVAALDLIKRNLLTYNCLIFYLIYIRSSLVVVGQNAAQALVIIKPFLVF